MKVYHHMYTAPGSFEELVKQPGHREYNYRNISQSELSRTYDRLVKRGYIEWPSVTRDGMLMTVLFNYMEMGVHVIVTDLPAPSRRYE